MKEEYSEILTEIAGKKENLVIFAGAGIPSATGIPTWKDLLKGLEKEVGEKCYEKPIEECKSSELPKFAQGIYERFLEKENRDNEKGEK